MDIPQQHAVDQQLHPLTFQPLQGGFGQRLIVLGLGEPLVIQQAPDALLFGCLGRVQWHRPRDLADLGRDAVTNPDYDQRQRLDLACQRLGQMCREVLVRAIIQR
jgi:hypothetical protein